MNAQLKVSKEVRDQLPKWITDDFIRKITGIAREIYGFFDRLSDDKFEVKTNILN